MIDEEKTEKQLTNDFIKKVNKYKVQLKKELEELCNLYLNKENNAYNKLQFKFSFDYVFNKYGIDISIRILDEKENVFTGVGPDSANAEQVLNYHHAMSILMLYDKDNEMMSHLNELFMKKQALHEAIHVLLK